MDAMAHSIAMRSGLLGWHEIRQFRAVARDSCGRDARWPRCPTPDIRKLPGRWLVHAM
jgi:hypothetical protein